MIGNTVSQQTVKEWPRDRNWLTTDNQRNPGKVRHTSAVYSLPTLFKQWCKFFYVPQEPDK